MNHPIDNLLEQAKKLSPAERAALIDALHDLNARPTRSGKRPGSKSARIDWRRWIAVRCRPTISMK